MIIGIFSSHYLKEVFRKKNIDITRVKEVLQHKYRLQTHFIKWKTITVVKEYEATWPECRMPSVFA